jgi:O-antigen/teichoic acid export membrane protein
MVRGRYDVRGVFFTVAMALRLLGTAVGALYGVTWAVAGFLVAQIVSTISISAVALVAYRRFPRSDSRPLAEDARDVRMFLFQSTVASSLTSMRGVLGTALMPVVSSTNQAAYFRNAQAPLTAFGALSSPARMVMLAEQTADYERGERERVIRALVRYSGATTLLMLIAVPIGWILMPWLMQLAFNHDFRVHATDAARLILIAGALQLIFGWSKTLPVTVGRPALRIWTHAIEVALFVPLVVIFGSLWGATGAGLALLVSTVAFCIAWTFLFLQIRHQIHAGTA